MAFFAQALIYFSNNNPVQSLKSGQFCSLS